MQRPYSKSIAIVFGSSGGIGTSIYQKLNNRNQYERVYGISRKNEITGAAAKNKTPIWKTFSPI